MNLEHKLIITGTGRTGTTFLVRLLTALRQPTGYDASNWQSDYFPHCTAGLERKLTDPESPYIVKDPELCVTLDGILAEGRIVVDHAIVPIRNIEAAALSRVRIGGSAGAVPGGVIGTDDPAQQQAVLADRFHRLVQTLVTRDIPHTFLLFPRFVQDADYLYAKLHPIFPTIERADFDRAFRALADPSLVHTFEHGRAGNSTAAAEFDIARRAKRRRRHLRRVGLWSSLAAVVVVALGSRWPTSATAASATPIAMPATASIPSTFTRQSALAPAIGQKLNAHRHRAAAASFRHATADLRLSDVGQPNTRTFTSSQGAPVPTVPLTDWTEFAP